MNDLEYALTSLGYRQTPDDPNKMVKPFGSNVFIVHLKEKRIANYFFDVKGIFRCWSSNNIQDCENKDKLSVYISSLEEGMFHALYLPHKPLGFFSKEQQYDMMGL